MRILGIDYGDARIGLALSDPTETLASALDPLEVRSMRKSIDEITALAVVLAIDTVLDYANNNG